MHLWGISTFLQTKWNLTSNRFATGVHFIHPPSVVAKLTIFSLPLHSLDSSSGFAWECMTCAQRMHLRRQRRNASALHNNGTVAQAETLAARYDTITEKPKNIWNTPWRKTKYRELKLSTSRQLRRTESQCRSEKCVVRLRPAPDQSESPSLRPVEARVYIERSVCVCVWFGRVVWVDRELEPRVCNWAIAIPYTFWYVDIYRGVFACGLS